MADRRSCPTLAAWAFGSQGATLLPFGPLASPAQSSPLDSPEPCDEPLVFTVRWRCALEALGYILITIGTIASIGAGIVAAMHAAQDSRLMGAAVFFIWPVWLWYVIKNYGDLKYVLLVSVIAPFLNVGGNLLLVESGGGDDAGASFGAGKTWYESARTKPRAGWRPVASPRRAPKTRSRSSTPAWAPRGWPTTTARTCRAAGSRRWRPGSVAPAPRWNCRWGMGAGSCFGTWWSSAGIEGGAPAARSPTRNRAAVV